MISSRDIEKANQDFISSHKNCTLLFDWYPLTDNLSSQFSRLQILAWDVNSNSQTTQSNTIPYKTDAKNLYLDLMKRCLMNLIYDNDKDMMRSQGVVDNNTGKIRHLEGVEYEPNQKLLGGIWPSFAHTMIGIKRLDNLQFCIENVLANNVCGDFIETGVWRGGATIFMRSILKSHSVTDRLVWVAESFAGLPPTEHPKDSELQLDKCEILAVSLEEVKSNFERYGLLDEQVKFLQGWFKDTLPNAPIEKLAVVRLDGDWYESTMDGLVNLYPKLSVGGYIIIDDYWAVEGCREAVQDYRKEYNLTEDMREIDGMAVYWQRLR